MLESLRRFGELLAMTLLAFALVIGSLIGAYVLTTRLNLPLSAQMDVLVVAALAIVVLAGSYGFSGGLLELSARIAYSHHRAAAGRWLARAMTRHPSRQVRLSGWDRLVREATLDGALDSTELVRDFVSDVWRMRPLRPRPWDNINGLVAGLVTLGRYQEAVELSDRWGADDARAPDGSRGFWPRLVAINRAEALHNLGRDEEALADLRRISEPSSDASDESYLRSGALCLEAWILAARKDPKALEVIERLDPAVLGHNYQSEVHFTRAAALAAVGAFEPAVAEAQTGLEKAVRPSSHRNGWFLLGSIAVAAGHWERSLEYFDFGLSSPYRGQGGPALLQRARALAELGRDAAEALRLVIERDPQSFAATEARHELAGL